MDSLIETFHIDWKIMLAQAVNFAIVLIVLYRFALRPLMKMMDERSAEIAKGLDDAKEKEKLLGEAKEVYDATVRSAREEATEILKSIKREGEQKRTELMQKAQEEAADILASGKAALEAEKQMMLTDAKKELVTLVVQATEKVLGTKGAGYEDEARKAISSINADRT